MDKRIKCNDFDKFTNENLLPFVAADWSKAGNYSSGHLTFLCVSLLVIYVRIVKSYYINKTTCTVITLE